MDHSYPLPSPEDIFTKLNGGKIFSKIDLSEAYFQVKVSEECSKYLCINTHLGLFRLKRLPSDLKVAPALFQQIMDTMLADLGFAIAYLDDILVKSKNVQEHKEDIRTVFQRIEEFGFKLSAEKCEFFLKQIKYLGQIIDSQGRRAIPRRTEAIEKMPAPNNVAQLQSFLGLAQYYAIYIPKMHKLRAPLNELLKKRQKWIWSKECQSAFEEIKKCLQSDLALAHFDPQKELIVASDASDNGLEQYFSIDLKMDQRSQLLMHPDHFCLQKETILKLKKKVWQSFMQLKNSIDSFMAGFLHCRLTTNPCWLFLALKMAYPLTLQTDFNDGA